MTFAIGRDVPVHICAELGQNHNGSLAMAKKLILAAKEAGVDSVKFQKRSPALCVPASMVETMRETPWGIMTYLAYRERLEFSVEQYREIDAYCKELAIPWFASIWDVSSLVALKENFPDLPAYKVPSAMLTNVELLRTLKRREVPIILSTGMSTMEQIEAAVGLLRYQGNRLVLCHCNSTYPCPVTDLNLRCIKTLRHWFPDVVVGYSGHEVGLATTLAAVALGSRYVERHLTLDRSMWGTDQAASIEPVGLRRLVKDIRNIERALGDGIKRVTEAEIAVMKRLRP